MCRRSCAAERLHDDRGACQHFSYSTYPYHGRARYFTVHVRMWTAPSERDHQAEAHALISGARPRRRRLRCRVRGPARGCAEARIDRMQSPEGPSGLPTGRPERFLNDDRSPIVIGASSRLARPARAPAQATLVRPPRNAPHDAPRPPSIGSRGVLLSGATSLDGEDIPEPRRVARRHSAHLTAGARGARAQACARWRRRRTRVR